MLSSHPPQWPVPTRGNQHVLAAEPRKATELHMLSAMKSARVTKAGRDCNVVIDVSSAPVGESVCSLSFCIIRFITYCRAK